MKVIHTYRIKDGEAPWLQYQWTFKVKLAGDRRLSLRVLLVTAHAFKPPRGAGPDWQPATDAFPMTRPAFPAWRPGCGEEPPMLPGAEAYFLAQRIGAWVEATAYDVLRPHTGHGRAIPASGLLDSLSASLT